MTERGRRHAVPDRIRPRAPRRAFVLLAFAVGCGPASGIPGNGLGVRHAYWRADDRVLVSEFRELGAVATDRRFVYAGGSNGVVVYDHRFQRWQPPLTLEDGFPRSDPPIALEVDEFTGILWMVTRTGALWAHHVSTSGEWRWIGVLPGGPPVRLTTHDGSLWALTSSGWFESAAGGAPPARRTAPAAVRDRTLTGLQRLERESAAFRSAGSSLTVDEYLRRYEITGAAPSPDPTEWWLATWGGGLYAYDDRMLEALPVRFGTVGRGVSAVAVVPDGGGFWFGGDGMSRRRGLAYADRDLQRWNWHEAGPEGAPAGPVHAVAQDEVGVFVGAQDGLYRLSGDRWDRLTDLDALPSTTVRALARSNDALWAGTDRGLVRVTVASDGGLAALRIDGTGGTRINALAAVDSILWLATDRGLWRLNTTTGALAQPPVQDARLRGRVIGVAYDGGILYALATSALLAYDGATWSAPFVGASFEGIGRPTHLAVRDDVVWIAGAAGALAIDPISGAESLLSVPRDIPEGPVRQVLPVEGGVWFATPAGALLIRLE
ncbi:MAG TPA: hypothetical protein VMN78_04145 [Longimicrobiales bacterium]|nr:hypothetical protein [Longimicrobiales bacterium]